MPLIRPFLVLGVALALALPAKAAEEDAGAYLAARSAVIASDYAEATSWFTRALITDPSNVQLLDGALIGRLSMGDFEGAVAIAPRLIQLNTVSASANITLMADQAKRGAFEDFLKDQDAGRSINPALDGLATAWAELGAGRMSDALASFDEVAKLQGMGPFARYHKALALASVGDFEGADAILSDNLRVNRRGMIARIQILSQLERGEDALELMNREFGQEPEPLLDSLRTRLAAGETLPFDIVRNATDGVAEVFFSVAGALNGEAADGYTLIYARIAQFLRPDHIDSILLAANLLQQQGQTDLAIQTYALVPATDPSFFAAELGRADAQAISGDTDAAIATLTELAETNGDLMMVHLSLGDLLRNEERFDEASQAYDRALASVREINQRHWVIYYSRGITHERGKQWELADADFRKALELNPGQPVVLNYLGYSLVERGEKLDEALGMIEQAVAAEPESGYIIDSLAWALFKLGRYDEALAPMEKASLLEPVDPIVTDHLGDVYWAVGRKLEAEFQWHRALSFDPEEDQAIRIRRKLEVGLDAVLQEEGELPLTERRAALDTTTDDPATVTEDGAGTDGN